MSQAHYQSLTTFELEKLKRSKSRAHDILVDTAPIGDERIYFLQQELDAIDKELKARAQ